MAIPSRRSPAATVLARTSSSSTTKTRIAVRCSRDPTRLAGRLLHRVAVSELAANTLNHTAAGGTLRCWQARNEVLCQIDDRGWITDPLAGRRLPPVDGQGGMGLWVVNQLCDLVELRTGEHGTVIRLHMRLPAGQPPAS
jgi:hypothetical protein